MSVMLLSNKHIATLALSIAKEICKGEGNQEQTAQHIAQELKRCNARAFNARYKEKERCTRVNLRHGDKTVQRSFARALADCWEYNSAEDGHGKLLRDLIERHLDVEPSNGVRSI